jgi:hypothetical protein
VAVTFASAVTGALAILLVGRGGGASTQAREATATPPVLAAPAVLEPATAAPAAAPAAAAPSEPMPPPSRPAEAAGDDGGRKDRGSHRHHSSHRQKAQADRVARGLSIDPFKP